MMKPHLEIVQPKVFESARVYLTVTSDVPHFVEENASCPVGEGTREEGAAIVEALPIGKTEEARLREDAVSAEHLACHLPKNPFCISCNRTDSYWN